MQVPGGLALQFPGYVCPSVNLHLVYNVHERYSHFIIASDWFVILISVRSVNFDFKGAINSNKNASLAMTVLLE